MQGILVCILISDSLTLSKGQWRSRWERPAKWSRIGWSDEVSQIQTVTKEISHPSTILCSVLIFGAQDTTASALSRVIYLLSRPENKHWQEDLRDEIMKARETCDVKNLDYDGISSLPLLDSVIKETLRLWVQLNRSLKIQLFIYPSGILPCHSSVESET